MPKCVYLQSSYQLSILGKASIGAEEMAEPCFLFDDIVASFCTTFTHIRDHLCMPGACKGQSPLFASFTF